MTDFLSIFLKVIHKVIVIFRAYALIAYALLLLIHFVIKDHFQYFQVLFYGFPLPVLLFLGTCVTLLHAFKPTTYFKYLLLGLMILGGIWIHTSYIFFSPPQIDNKTSSVMFWNTADRKTLPLDIIIKTVEEVAPDVIGFVEAENASEEDLTLLHSKFPKYQFQILPGNMFVGIKGEIKEINNIAEKSSYDINFIKAHISTGNITIALTDTFQNPAMDKRTTLNTVLDLVQLEQADLVIGDFNTPYESVHFRNYEKYFKSFHNYGQGFSATWPYGLPLLEIDQIYISPKYVPIFLQKFNHPTASDHKMLIAYFK